MDDENKNIENKLNECGVQIISTDKNEDLKFDNTFATITFSDKACKKLGELTPSHAPQPTSVKDKEKLER